MTSMCPCHNCICVPVCRHKTFSSLYFDCALMQRYFSQVNAHAYIHLQDILRPTKWKVQTSDKCVIDVINEED